MTNNDKADRIEETIGRVFAYVKTFDSGVTEYSILFNPQKHASWFILIFFSDMERLREGLEGGLCNLIYTYINNQLNEDPGTADMERHIYFEAGKRPTERPDMENMLERLIKKTELREQAAGQTDSKTCANCGHDSDGHILLYNTPEGGSPPTEGWMICHEGDCNCFHTWGAGYKGGEH